MAGLPERRSRWRGVPAELLLVVSGIVVYFGVRGVTVTDVAAATDHATDLVRMEQRLGLYHEPALQALVAGSDPAMTLMNWVYIWGHWPVIVAVLLWLFTCHPTGYRRYRNAMLVSGGLGLVVFALYPVAPPRLAGLGLVDTVTEFSTAYRVLQPPAFVNQYAAMPSLHVGWDLLMGMAIVTYARWWWLKVVGALLPVLMVAAVVLTANHYLVDAVVGAALVLSSFAGLALLDRRRARRAPLPVPGPRTTGESVGGAGRRVRAGG